MDELGRGTSTFDGTAIASATVKHLIERSRCLSLFATHYHSLLEEWKSNPSVRLGHMECVVSDEGRPGGTDASNGSKNDVNITFLYTLGEGVCPKSFGINVARLAGLPDEVLIKAARISSEFEEALTSGDGKRASSAGSVQSQKEKVMEAIESGDLGRLAELWKSMQQGV
jgi:DNA mismatch repair protein MSH6